jgi:hypothetical protein
MAEAGVRTFDPKTVSVIWGGYTITGFADGTFIKVTRIEKKLFESKGGADGTRERINKNSLAHMVEFMLMQTAQANGIMSAATILDQESNVGAPELIIKDGSGISVFTSGAAWIAEDADMELATTLTPRKWVMETGPALKVLGGNTSLLSTLASVLP